MGSTDTGNPEMESAEEAIRSSGKRAVPLVAAALALAGLLVLYAGPSPEHPFPEHPSPERSSAASPPLPSVAKVASKGIAADSACPNPTAPPELGTRRSRWILFENAPTHALEPLPERGELWMVNPGGASLTVVSTPAGGGHERVVAEVPVGLGPVSVRRRPGSDELWAVCQSSNAVFVVDIPSRRVADVLPVAHEPTDVAFDSQGRRAFVVTSASDEVIPFDAETRQRAAASVVLDVPVDPRWRRPSVGGGGPAPRARVQEPRRLIYAPRSGRGEAELLVLVHRSGNGTGPDPHDRDGDRVRFEVVDPRESGDPPVPDADVLRLAVTGGGGLAGGDGHSPSRLGAPSVAAEAVGTVLYDAELDARGRLWVTNTDLRNQDAAGLYQLRREGFVRPRLSVVERSDEGTKIHAVDLAADRLAALPTDPDHQCATPTDVLLSPGGERAYVACYGSRNVAVVDTALLRVVALLRPDAGAAGADRGFGPRGLAIVGDALYVYHRGDQVLQRFAVPADGEVRGPERTLDAGYDPTPAPVVAGRHHFVDARRSVDGLRSCDACHVDGQTDGLAWTMSDYGGDLEGISGAEPFLRVAFPQTKTTQDLRSAEERPPYHWFGDRHDLADFALLFVGLLDAPRPGERALAELEAYVFSLTLPPNPGARAERSLSAEALAGYGCFEIGATHHVSTHRPGIPALGGATEGRIRVSCQDCHAMAGGLTSSNQLTNDARFPVPSVPTDLRGLFDKRATVLEHEAKRWPASGWGFGSSGVFASTAEFTEATFRGEVTAPQIGAVEGFLAELDSGTAPLAAFAAPVAEAPVERLLEQADAGWLDLIFRRSGGDPEAWLYDPVSGDRPPAAFAAAGGPEGFHYVLATPPGLGRRLALDRDGDFLPDADEAVHGTSPTDPDHDGDGFPDGHEVHHGANPASSASRPADGRAPRILDAELVWSASTVAHVRFRTDEEALARVRVVRPGAGAETGQVDAGDAEPREVVWSGESLVLAREHAFVARGLAAGASFELWIDAVDPAGHRSASARLGVTSREPLFPFLAVPETTLRVVSAGGLGEPPRLEAAFRVVDERRRAVAGATVHFHLLEWGPDGRWSHRELKAGPSDAEGVARARVAASRPAGAGGFAEVSVDRRWDRGVLDPAERLYFFPADLELGHWARVDLP